MESLEFDAIVIGAGMSGINASYRLKTQVPFLRFVVLEARERLGGTWDMWKYPGLRSDSELQTYGFPWYPWKHGPPIASGPAIRNYMEEAARECGISQQIRYKHKVKELDYSPETQSWKLVVNNNGKPTQFVCRFLIFGSGYYDQENPRKSVIPKIESFEGKVIHPQSWPEDYDYSDKRIVVIGSGATAITLVPALAEKASSVTMIQRSPTYIYSPNNNENPFNMYSIMPEWFVDQILRLWFVVAPMLFYNFCIQFPNAARRLMRKQTAKLLPKNIPHDPHFKPSYGPWRQRMTVSPKGEFFQTLRHGKAGIVTGVIKHVTKNSVVMEDGQEVPADVIVTATGLRIGIGLGMDIKVNGEPINMAEKLVWRGMMIQDIPNAFFLLGYINHSWNLGADATSQTITRILKRMQVEGKTAVIPRAACSDQIERKEIMNLVSTYVAEGSSTMPKAGDRGPWMRRTNYLYDLWFAKMGNLTDGLEYHQAKRIMPNQV